MKTKYPHIFLCAKEGLSIDDVGEGVEGHRISGDTLGSWFRNRRSCSRKVGRATVERLVSNYGGAGLAIGWIRGGGNLSRVARQSIITSVEHEEELERKRKKKYQVLFTRRL